MFVIERVRAAAEIREQSEMNTVVNTLAAAGHRPVLRSMVTAATHVAALHESSLGVDILASRDPRYRALQQQADAPIGDLLFTGTEGFADRCYFVQPFNATLFVFEIRHHSIATGLPDFCTAVEQAIRSRLDGRRVRGMNFTWNPIKERIKPRPAGSSRFLNTELKTKNPDYSSEELRAARLLVGSDARNFVLQLAKIGKVRETDAKLPTALIEQLQAEHLLSKEYLVLCKKDSHTLCQVANADDLKEIVSGKFVCTTCGRKFSDETVLEIFAQTPFGKQLVSSSRWMTIWITDLLIQAGLSKETIAWSATSGDDEIDIMTDELGLRIFFELKDREFGLGDAYPFSYRMDRYGGDVGVVVSTDKIAEKAYKFFREQQSKSTASIETLAAERVEKGLRELIDKYSRVGVQRTLASLSEPLGINIVPVEGGGESGACLARRDSFWRCNSATCAFRWAMELCSCSRVCLIADRATQIPQPNAARRNTPIGNQSGMGRV